MPLTFEHSYAALPARFYSHVAPQPVAAPELIAVNRPLAERLGVDGDFFASQAGVELVAGNRIPADVSPIALAYAGHQFGQFNPQLGDGRALLLGEIIAPDGERYDLQLKGSGRTPYSRGGDGRSPLGPVLREYVVSEAMAALGIPTTRALSAVTSGEAVQRERSLPGGVLLRVARSHIRVGTFEFFGARDDQQALRLLLDHVVARHYPQLQGVDEPAVALLGAVAKRQAELVAQWMLVGFIHGVMNTDNMLVSGETIDYGPCAFMDEYNPDTVFSSIDVQGRYAYKNQPLIARWNVACLARALLPLFASDEAQVSAAQTVIDGFPQHYEAAYQSGLGRKLGFSTRLADDDALGSALLQHFQDHGIDFTLGFRRLSELADPQALAESSVASLVALPATISPWLQAWEQRLQQDPRSPEARAQDMRRCNPALIARNHQVEAAIRAAEDDGDFGRFHALVDVLQSPFEYRSSLADYARPPKEEERVLKTFCGT